MTAADAEPAASAPGRAGSDRRPRVPVAVWVTALVVVALDQLTKTLALEHLSGRPPVHLVWTLQLDLSFNSGAAFGLGRGITPLLTVAAVAMVGAMLVVARSLPSRGAAVALGLVLGGAFGNLVDRLVRDHGGAVVDFIDFQWFPVFNVADIGITVGAALLVLLGSRS